MAGKLNFGLQNVNENEPIQFVDVDVTPVMTGILILGCFFTFFMMQTTGHGNYEFWLQHNGFNYTQAAKMLQAQDWGGLITAAAVSTFGTIPLFKLPIQLGLDVYFLWVFGKHVEQKLGPARYMMLVILGIFLPYAVLYWDVAGKDDTYYLSPIFLISTIIGTYMVFPPVPKARYGKHNVKQRGEIFRKGGRPDPLEKYTANPWMFMVVFAVVQTIFHFWFTIGFGPFERQPGFDTIRLIPIAVSIAVGYVLGQMLHHQATKDLKQAPMTLACIKRYNELIELDVSPDDAIKGTARTLGLPYEKVKEWVKKNKGSMRVK